MPRRSLRTLGRAQGLAQGRAEVSSQLSVSTDAAPSHEESSISSPGEVGTSMSGEAAAQPAQPAPDRETLPWNEEAKKEAELCLRNWEDATDCRLCLERFSAEPNGPNAPILYYKCGHSPGMAV